MIDYALVFAVFLGIYLEVAIMLSSSVPIPSALAGAAGLTLIWRRRDDLTSRQLAAFLAIVLVLVLASLAAPDLRFLPKRMTGIIQMTYSLVIAFALFMTLVKADRRILARLFFSMCVTVLIGAQLESFAWMRAMSDGARQVLYRSGIYESDLRDLIFYGKVRPKLFTSEPSAVTFSFALYALAWFLTTASRYRLAIFAVLIGAGQLVIPGPTTLLAGVAAGASYFLLPDRYGRNGFSRRLGFGTAAVLALGVLLVVGSSLYSERLDAIMSGRDPSFFYRVLGPALVALRVFVEHPLTGIGLTSEAFGAELAMNVFVQSPQYSSAWKFEKFSDVLTNYFWLHWIYLGAVFGSLTLIAVNVWLRSLGVRAVVYCWAVWALFGQASGAYVGPKTWIVLLMIAALVHPLRQAIRPPSGQTAMAYRLNANGVVQLPYTPNWRSIR